MYMSQPGDQLQLAEPVAAAAAGAGARAGAAALPADAAAEPPTAVGELAKARQ